MSDKTKVTSPNMEYGESITIEGKVTRKSRVVKVGKAKIPRLDVEILSTLNGKPHKYKSVVWGNKAYKIKKSIKKNDIVIAEGRPTKNNCLKKPFYYLTLDSCITIEEHNHTLGFSKSFFNQ